MSDQLGKRGPDKAEAGEADPGLRTRPAAGASIDSAGASVDAALEDAAPASLVRARRIAWLMDDSVPLPGTRFRFGLDPLLGLGPGVGDAVSWVISLHLLWAGWRLRAGPTTLVRMAGNVLLDTVLGAVPAIGDLFDFVFKANDKNLKILEGLNATPDQTRRSSVIWLTLIMTTSVAAMAATAWAILTVLRLVGGVLGF